MTEVSIIIPVFQVSDYIERCIRSVIGQTYKDIECIIIDDRTLDDSIEKCNKLIGEYDGLIKFQILHHNVNQGLSSARNTGTRVATGSYIFYLDADDVITQDCIERLMEIALENPESEMIIGNIQMISRDDKKNIVQDGILPSQIQSPNEIVALYHKKQIPGYAWNKLIKRSFLDQHLLHFKEGIIFEDFLWMFYVVKYLSNICYYDKVTYLYYVRPGSIFTSSDDLTTGNSFRIIYDEILHHLTKGRERIELNRYVTGFCKCYYKYVEDIPGYEDIYDLFLTKSKEHRSWRCYTILAFVGFIGKFGHPLGLLRFLKSVRSINRIFRRSNNVKCLSY